MGVLVAGGRRSGRRMGLLEHPGRSGNLKEVHLRNSGPCGQMGIKDIELDLSDPGKIPIDALLSELKGQSFHLRSRRVRGKN